MWCMRWRTCGCGGRWRADFRRDGKSPQDAIYTCRVDTSGTFATPAPVSSTIVILDFGSQYTQLIARRIREFNVFSVVLPCTTALEKILALKPKGIVLSGGPSSVYDDAAPKADKAILDTGLPILGICYGLQFMTHHLGGRVVPADAREYGHAEVNVVDETPLFSGLPATMSVWMSHGDHAEALAPGFRVTARTSNAASRPQRSPLRGHTRAHRPAPRARQGGAS